MAKVFSPALPPGISSKESFDDLAQHITRLNPQIETPQAEASELHYLNFKLGRRNAELEALVTKDSHNSSRPLGHAVMGRE